MLCLHLRPVASTCIWPQALVLTDSRKPSSKTATATSKQKRPLMTVLDLGLLGDFEGVINFDTQVSDRGLQLGEAEQRLHGSEVLGAPIDQSCLVPSHRVRPVFGALKTQLIHPVTKNPDVLPSTQVGRFVEPAGEEGVIGFQCSLFDPRLQRVSGCSRDLELDWALGLVLHNDGARGQLLPMADVANLEGYEVASAQLAIDTEVEECELADPPLHLKADAQCPDIFQFEGRLLSNIFPLFRWARIRWK